MAPWLSEEWTRQVGAASDLLPSVDGLSASVNLVIAVSRREEVRVSWRYADGVPAESPAGESSADLEMSVSAEEAADLFTGRVEPSVAFMRGRLKATGNQAVMLGFLQSTSKPAFTRWRDEALALADPAKRPTFTE